MNVAERIQKITEKNCLFLDDRIENQRFSEKIAPGVEVTSKTEYSKENVVALFDGYNLSSTVLDANN